MTWEHPNGPTLDGPDYAPDSPPDWHEDGRGWAWSLWWNAKLEHITTFSAEGVARRIEQQAAEERANTLKWDGGRGKFVPWDTPEHTWGEARAEPNIFNPEAMAKTMEELYVHKGKAGSDYGGSPAHLKDKDEELLSFIIHEPNAYYCSVDGGVPKQRKYQASAAALVYKGSKRLSAIRQPAGRITSIDAELQAICVAITECLKFEECHHIVIFTDTLVASQRALNPSTHFSQSLSLVVCKELRRWASSFEDGHPILNFVHVPSTLAWGPQHAAHLYLRELPRIPAVPQPVKRLRWNSCGNWITSRKAQSKLFTNCS